MNAVRVSLKAIRSPDSLVALAPRHRALRAARRRRRAPRRRARCRVAPPAPVQAAASDAQRRTPARHARHRQSLHRALPRRGERVWVMLHSGSRGIGNQIGTLLHRAARRSDMERYFITCRTATSRTCRRARDAFRRLRRGGRLGAGLRAREPARMMDAVLELRCGIGICRRSRSTHEAVNCHHNYVAREHHFGKNVLRHAQGRGARARGRSRHHSRQHGRALVHRARQGQPRELPLVLRTARAARCRARQAQARSPSRTSRGRRRASSAARTTACSTRLPAAYKDIDEVMASQARPGRGRAHAAAGRVRQGQLTTPTLAATTRSPLAAPKGDAIRARGGPSREWKRGTAGCDLHRISARTIPVAQWIERPPPKRQVAGSTPARGAISRWSPLVLTRYRIVPLDPHAHCSRSADDRRSAPDGQRYRLPTWVPGSYLVREFARHFVQVRADNPTGAVAIEKSRQEHVARRGRARRSRSTAKVYAFELSVRTPTSTPRAGTSTAVPYCWSAGGPRGCAVHVEIVAPARPAYAAWRVRDDAPRRAPERGVGTYRAADYDELIDHPVEMGEFAWTGFDVRGVPTRSRSPVAHDADMARLARDLARVCQ